LKTNSFSFFFLSKSTVKKAGVRTTVMIKVIWCNNKEYFSLFGY